MSQLKQPPDMVSNKEMLKKVGLGLLAIVGTPIALYFIIMLIFQVYPINFSNWND